MKRIALFALLTAGLLGVAADAHGFGRRRARCSQPCPPPPVCCSPCVVGDPNNPNDLNNPNADPTKLPDPDVKETDLKSKLDAPPSVDSLLDTLKKAGVPEK